MPAPTVLPMPRRHPRVAHFLGRVHAYLLGDSPRAVRMALSRLFPWIDQNLQPDGGPAGSSPADGHLRTFHVVHWSDLRDYPWIWTGGYVVHRGKKVEKRVRHHHRNLHKMPTAAASLLRSKQFGGRRLMTFESRASLIARAHNRRRSILRAMWEHKATPTEAEARYLHGYAASVGCYGVAAHLDTIKGWQTALQNLHAGGWQTALLRHNRRNAITRANRPDWLDGVW